MTISELLARHKKEFADIYGPDEHMELAFRQHNELAQAALELEEQHDAEIKRLADALQTDERGGNLVAVASAASRAEREYAAAQTKAAESNKQESPFHPDWSLLEATRASLREHQEAYRKLEERAKVLAEEWYKIPFWIRDKYTNKDDADTAAAAILSAGSAELPAERVLLDTDPFCPSCGHNRDISSVSTIDISDGRKQCQRCSTAWREIADHSTAATTEKGGDANAGTVEAPNHSINSDAVKGQAHASLEREQSAAAGDIASQIADLHTYAVELRKDREPISPGMTADTLQGAAESLESLAAENEKYRKALVVIAEHYTDTDLAAKHMSAHARMTLSPTGDSRDYVWTKDKALRDGGGNDTSSS